MSAFQGVYPRTTEELAARRIKVEEERAARAAACLAQERRTPGRGKPPPDEFGGLDSATVKALSAGTIKRPRAAEGYGYS